MSGQELKRTMGLSAALATACGLVVASSTLVTLGQGFGLGGGGFIWAMILAMLVNLFVAFSFAELSGIIPKAGSVDYFTTPALGRLLAIMAVIAGYVIVTIFAGSSEASVPGLMLNSYFPSISPVIYSTVVVLLLAWANMRGVQVYAWVQVSVTVLMMASLAIIGILGLLGITPAVPIVQEGGFNPMGAGVLGLTALGFWLFVGLEFVTPMAEEIKNPNKTIPLAMMGALGVVMVCMILFGYASLRYTKMDVLANSVTPQVDAATAMFGSVGAAWMGIVTVFASVSTINTLMAAVGRMVYGMALKGQAPAFFGKIHPKYKTPTWAIGFIALCIITPIWVGITNLQTIVVYVLAGAFSWCFAYLIIHTSVIVLRVKYPNVNRPFKTPLYPLPQLIGIVAIIYMMLNIYPDPEMKAQIYKIGFIFLGIGVVMAAVWLGLVKKQPMFKPAPLQEVLGEAEEESRKVAEVSG